MDDAEGDAGGGVNEAVAFESRHGARIRTQHAEQRSPLLERGQRFRDMRIEPLTAEQAMVVGVK
jgi:hypothetical protein